MGAGQDRSDPPRRCHPRGAADTLVSPRIVVTPEAEEQIRTVDVALAQPAVVDANPSCCRDASRREEGWAQQELLRAKRRPPS
jgi:hypothetical protein